MLAPALVGLSTACALIQELPDPIAEPLGLAPPPLQPIGAHDHELLIRASDLRPFGVEVRDPEDLEELVRRYFADGSIHLTYRYTNLDRARGTPLSVYLRVSIEPSEAVARRVFGERSSSNAVGALGRDLRWEDEFFVYGDESRFGYIFVNGQPDATLFHSRKGRRLFSFVAAGLVIDDPAVWQALVEPRLQALERRSPLPEPEPPPEEAGAQAE